MVVRNNDLAVQCISCMLFKCCHTERENRNEKDTLKFVCGNGGNGNTQRAELLCGVYSDKPLLN